MRGKLQVPKSQEEALIRIINMSDADMSAFASTLERVSHATTIRKLSDAVAKEVPLSDSETFSAIRALSNLYTIMDRLGLSIPEFIDEIERASRETENKRLAEPETGWSRARERFRKLLSLESLGLTAKAFDLLTEAEKVFCDARIISDVRPIFLKDVGHAPNAFIILHTLRLAFHQNGRLETIDVALDSSDIGLISEVLERATSKEESIHELAEKMKLPVMRASSHNG